MFDVVMWLVERMRGRGAEEEGELLMEDEEHPSPEQRQACCGMRGWMRGCEVVVVRAGVWGMLMEWVRVRWLAWEESGAVEMGGWDGGRSNAMQGGG